MRRQFVTHPQFQFSFTLSFVLGVSVLFALIGGTTIVTLFMLAGHPSLSETQRLFFQASGREFLAYLIYLYLFSLIVFSMIGFYLSYKFVGPLARLENWLAERLSSGSVDPIKLRPGDELEGVSLALNRLLLRIFTGRR